MKSLGSLVRWSIPFCLLTMISSVAMAADANGVWKWTRGGGAGARGGRGGGAAQEVTGTFKIEGEKLTGTVDLAAAAGGRGGAGVSGPTEIKNGTFKSDEVAFETERSIDLMGTALKIKTKYKGKIEGDKITGTQEQTTEGAPAGGRGGAAQGPQPWEANREKK